ncbi:EamA family transporter [Dictyobacter arantiisoli]|uniref:EamA family transporter n=2 Tax=Dictyobacter arantiisoli TaxID=2014874 RepID=A0A5A5TA89_9CHLR|nr:EamA family transporter [Dictyobacter arantiisoli]
MVILLGLLTRQPMRIRSQEFPRFLLYGLVTALHFVFYVASLNYTTTAHSLALVYTSPLLVTILSALFLRESMATRKLLGILVAVIGIAIMVGFEPHYTACSLTGQCMFLGDGFALLSALCYAIYSVIGRSERDRHPLFRYTTHVYRLAALWLLPLACLNAFRHPYTLSAMGAVAALGIFPLGLGHTLYNAALRKVHATYANLIATQEVTIGIVLGIVFLHDIPSWTTVIGVLVTLGGITSVLL